MFIIYGNVQFVPGKYDEWQAAYDKLDEYVFANEPTTMTYYFGIPMEYKDNFSATNQMLAFEVYGKREDLYETHFHSTGMEPFLKATPPTMAIGFDLTHYTEVSGFLDKSGRAAECAVIYDTKIVCASAFARDTILSRLESIAEHAEGEESGTYTFWVLRSLENEEEVRIFERYESWEALELHQKAPGLINFWLDSKEEVRSMEGRAYAPNLKGWLNRSVQRSDPIIDRVGNELSFVHH